ncbi:cilia- and flagella-associated protein 65 [Spea bombifrons]|uniref:cilia- and flagella-associated protein 65 n=1 Tax=Spea bombifrons TaxID=233779 RepID=UPI00234B4D94|nr:cilia- and flagella-associated protein 65 [Spea bombifrons]
MLAQLQTRALESNSFLGQSDKVSDKLRKDRHQIRTSLQSVKKAKKRDVVMGFEVRTFLHWQHWEPGKEITKHLALKNVKLKTQKVQFRPPSTPFFRTLFPQSVTLMSGTSFSLPITFRPLEKRDYEDFITFEAEEGSFSVVLRATLPRHELLFQEELTIPTCAVHHSSEASFVLHNACDLQTSFRWEVSDPFTMTPASGTLHPRCETPIKVLFQPQMALVHSVVAVCRFGVNEEYNKSIQLTSIAKYPHLVLRVAGAASEEDEPLLDFGSAGVGAVVEKHIEIHNVSAVDSPFRIERATHSSQMDCHFFCDIERSVVPAQGKLKIPVQFRPHIPGMETVDYFHVIPAGNLTKSVLKVAGTCQGPRVSILKSLMDFGLVNLGEQMLRTLEITNSSDVPAHYQFDIDSSESVFSFDHPYGIIGPRETRTLQVTFAPRHPIPHYRRVACLLHHQDPLFLDLIGTCHSDTEKPAIVLPKHLPLYRKNAIRGLTAYPPDVLNAMLQEGRLGKDADGALVLLTQESDGEYPEEHGSMNSVSEFFNDEFSSDNTVLPPHVTATKRDFDFGCSVGNGQKRSLPLSLTNHTKGKVSVIWTSNPDCPFQVTPQSTEIPPLKSTAFTVVFGPSQPNTLYAGELEGFIFYKVLRDYRNVEDATMCLPWCITLHARGHTFERGHQHFVPSCTLDCPRAVFPPVKQNGQAQRTLLIQNTGPLPLAYAIDQTSCPSAQVKPASGQIPSGSHQILLLRTSPTQAGLTRHQLPLQLNFSPDFTQEIVLFSRAEAPQLVLEGDGKLFFKPTCVGTQSERSYSLKNCSRFPLRFQWKIQQPDASFISVTPSSGTIRPNESMVQTWSFVPQEERKYFAKATALTWAAVEDLKPVEKMRYILRITGEGCRGTLSALQEQVDLGDILVGSFQSWDLPLSNDGDCTLEYTLSAKQEINGPCDQEEVTHDPVALEFENSRGCLPARTKLSIRVTARPARRLQYIWKIFYSILTPKALDPSNAVSKEHFLCCVTAQGVYPVLSIVDVCAAGSATSLNKTQLWRLFSLERINTYLKRDPTPAELIYRVPTRHSVRRCPPINTPVLLDFNFGAAPVGSEPFVTFLLLENRGVVPVNWEFLFPADQQIELEFWAETFEFEQSEIHQMRIQDNKLFAASPKSGTVNPGQQHTVQLSYRHDFVGIDRLPVLLKLSHGREILLNFIGVTVEKDQRYVHFTSTKHQFTPVAIGSSGPPKQIYELYNGGAVAVIYEIQQEPLKAIQEENYHHPVFQCLNPRGEILPGATAFVEWIFSPLEAKTYSVTVPVHILGGDSVLVTFEGIGYDRDALGDSAVFENFSPLPATPRLTAPGQQVLLSLQSVTFGDIPVFSKSSRLLFLNNTSRREAAFFTWCAGSPHVNEALHVSPASGVLRPGESTNVIVTLHTGEQAAFYTLDLVCEIFMEKALAKYHQELLEWEEERERQSLEFTITEHGREKKESPAWHGLASSGSGASKGTQELKEIRRYKTLPPIKNGEVSRPPATRDRGSRRAEKERQRFWPQPEHPDPLHLHLSVTGRSHHTQDFFNLLQNDFHRHFHYWLPKDREEKPAHVDLQPETGESDASQRKPTLQQQELAVDIMASVIQNLLDDPRFHEAIEQIGNDPLPYFSQLGTREKPSNRGGTPGAKDTGSSEARSDVLAIEGKRNEKGETTRGEKEPSKRGEEGKERHTEEEGEEHHTEEEGEGCHTEEEGEERQTEEEGEERHTEEEGEERHTEEEGEEHVTDEERGLACAQTDVKSHTAQEELKEKIKRSPGFAHLAESVLENTLQNILIEANRGEVVLTARPRVIALPPVTPRGISPTSTARTLSTPQNDQATADCPKPDISDNGARTVTPTRSQRASFRSSHPAPQAPG